MRRLLLSLSLLMLAACQGTVLEHEPAGLSTDCPEGYAGAWIALDDGGRHEDTGFLIAADCGTEVIEARAEPGAEPARLAPRFRTRDGVRLLVLSQAEVARLFQDELRERELPATALWPMRWGLDGDQLVLVPPDHRRIATLIVQGALDGETHWVGRDSGLNRVREDGAALERALGSAWFWGGDELRLSRVGDDRAALDAALARVRSRDAGE